MTYTEKKEKWAKKLGYESFNALWMASEEVRDSDNNISYVTPYNGKFITYNYNLRKKDILSFDTLKEAMQSLFD